MEPQNQAPQDPNQPTIQDDSLAAALGFLTTISELHMGIGQEEQGPTDMQSNGEQSQTPPEAPTKPQEESSGQDEDKARDDAMEAEIADIRAELEMLKKDEQNDTPGTTTEDTEPVS